MRMIWLNGEAPSDQSLGPVALPGLSNYELARLVGFQGDLEAWLAAQVGPQGEIAPEDRARFDVAVAVSENLASVIADVEEARSQAVPAAVTATEQAIVARDFSATAALLADFAAGSAQASAASADVADLQRQAAEAARSLTEVYATSSATSARFYDTIALGRAAVADGLSFGVRAGQADGLERPTIYRRDSATTQTFVVSLLRGSDLDQRVRQSSDTAVGHALLSGAPEHIASHLSPDGATLDVAGLRIQRSGTAVTLTSFDGLPIDIPGFEGVDLDPLTQQVATVEARVVTLEGAEVVIPDDLSVQSVTMGETLLREALGTAVQIGPYTAIYVDTDGALVARIRDPDGLVPGGGGTETDLGPLTQRVQTVEGRVEDLEANGGAAIPADLSVQTVTLGTTLLREAPGTAWLLGPHIAAYFDTDGALVARVRDPDGLVAGGSTDLGPLTTRVTIVETDLDALEAQVAGLSGGAAATTFSNAEIASWDAWAAGWTYNFVNTPHMLQRIEPGALNHFVMAGESFAAAQNGSAAPAYHTGVLHPNTYMLGESEHSSIEQTALNTAEQIGAAVLNPLRGTTVSLSASGQPRTVLTEEEFYAAVAAEGPSPSNRGESLAVMAIYQMRLMAAAYFGSQQPGDVVLTNVGRSGATTEMWLKGSQLMAGTGSTSPTGVRLYSKFVDTVSRVRAAATEIAKPHRLIGVFWNIGRNNYVHGRDGALSATRMDGMEQNPFSVATEADYLAQCERIKADFNADARQITGQARDPTWVCDQADGPYTDDTFKLGVGNATRKFARFDNGVILGSPTYHVPDKNHLDLNGYRWVGCQQGKALFKTLYLGQRWKPLEPLKVIWRGSQILIPFHVPVAPLLWREVIDSVAYSSRFYPTRGFRVTAGGEDFLTSTPVISAGGRCIILNLTGVPSVAPEVWYAPRIGTSDFRGHGNLADSDASLSYASYVFDHAGMHPAANIASLVGNPYPQNNFCTAFYAVADHA